jgi:hypothetical protein
MRSIRTVAWAAAAAALWAGEARADGWTTPPQGSNPPLSPPSISTPARQPADASGRAISRAVESYVRSATADPTLLGSGAGAGYDRSFWIRSGEHRLNVTLLLQARWEAYTWDDSLASPASGGGDLSGFSLPRAAMMLTGTAPCHLRWLALLEFGHHGGPGDNSNNAQAGPLFGNPPGGDMPNAIREAWIEWGRCPELNARMGLLKLPCTRQLMTPAGSQQFVDISMGSSYIGHVGIGYQDRNRDYGVELHGTLGARHPLEYSFTVSNGDGARRRNVFDGGTDDGFAYSGRLDWDFVGHKGYDEGAPLQTLTPCDWVASAGVWAQYRAARADMPHRSFGDLLAWGVDAAVGRGGFSFTGAWSMAEQQDSDIATDFDGSSWLAQAGYLFPGTAWEIAVRGSGYVHDPEATGQFAATEIAAAVIYYVNGHFDKIAFDVARILPSDDGNILFDVMAGYNANRAIARTSDAWLFRLQWQLVL